MKKIVIDARMYSTSTGRYIKKLIENLEKIDATSDHKYVILLQSKDLDQYQPKAGNFTKLAADFKDFSFAEQLGFNKFLKSLGADLVHFGMVQQPVLYKKPKVTTMHDLSTLRFLNPAKNKFVMTIKQFVYRWVNIRAAKDSLTVITPSEFVKKDIAKLTGVNPNKITVTYESADKITQQPQVVDVLKDKKFIFYLGQAFPHKNLERLVQAFALLYDQFPELYLTLAGKKTANHKILEDFIVKNSIKNVIFTDFVSEGQLKWLYENCRAYIFPSLSEGFGLPGLEAMAHGAPVVSSNATCLPEIYGDAAMYFNPLDVKDMANKIAEVLNNDTLRLKLIDNGALQINQFSWQRMAEQTLEIYKKAIES
jgi:glycosyltransferase involved in cell wall biosynthesis